MLCPWSLSLIFTEQLTHRSTIKLFLITIKSFSKLVFAMISYSSIQEDLSSVYEYTVKNK